MAVKAPNMCSEVITVVTVPRASVTPSEVFIYYCNEARS